MSTAKPNRRRTAQKLEPIDWREFANDAVLNGNMSTLYHRPPTEDPTAYASPEALAEIQRRTVAKARSGPKPVGPTVGVAPTAGTPELPVAMDPAPAPGPEDRSQRGISEVSGVLARDPVLVVANNDAVGLGGIEGLGEPGELEKSMKPTVGRRPTVGRKPPLAEGRAALDEASGEIQPPRSIVPTVGSAPAVGTMPTVGTTPTVGAGPSVVARPTVGLARGVVLNNRKVKPIRDVQDALTLAGQVLYKAMYGAPDGGRSKVCSKGYRQLAAETYLDKDTVRDLIREFKEKGIVRETGTYDPDTRSAKTYDVLSYRATLQLWREAGLLFVTTGRQRPTFCNAAGEVISFEGLTNDARTASSSRVPGVEDSHVKSTVGGIPTVSSKPTVGMTPTVGVVASTERLSGTPGVGLRPTVGSAPTVGLATAAAEMIAEVIVALQQVTGLSVDQEAAERLIQGCQEQAADCRTEEILEFVWSKAFMCRSGKIENPIGFLITQVPKHFHAQSITAHRERKAKEAQASAAAATQEAARQEAASREIAELERQEAARTATAERHRTTRGIDLRAVLEDNDSDESLRHWADRMLKLGQEYCSRY